MNYILKSPIFYMGNKYRLLPQLLELFPKGCNVFVDLFGGSGCVCGNYFGKSYNVYNEFNPNVYSLSKLFIDYSSDIIINHIRENITKWDLGYGCVDKSPKDEEHYRKNYLKFRESYNKSDRNYLDLYTLTFYSFSNLIRFNSDSDFNMPWGIRCFTKEHEYMIESWCERLNKHQIKMTNCDYKELLNNQPLQPGDFVYADPPYSQSMAVYNENRAFGGWSIENDLELFAELDKLTQRGIRWGLSNIFSIRDKENTHLIDWCNKNNYNVYHLDIDYAALGSGSTESDEVYICNYKPEIKFGKRSSLL